MADGLLSQADIDALIQGQREKGIAAPKAKSKPAAAPSTPTSSQPAAKSTPVVSQPSDEIPLDSMLPKENPEPADPKKPDTLLEARMLKIEKRLDQMEKTARSIEQLERKLSNPNTGMVTAQQLQAVVQRMQELTQEVANISNKLKGTLGYGAYQTFICDKCSSKGHVATQLKCTECGQESWRGWWPKK